MAKPSRARVSNQALATNSRVNGGRGDAVVARRVPGGTPRLLALTITCALALMSALPAQRGKKADRWREDPYTKGADSALQKLGYENLGPFAWGDDHDTARIEQTLGKASRIRWVETKHFRIGSTLPTWKTIRKGKHAKRRRAQLGSELEKLRSKLPKLKKRPKALDPWLRVHLFAQRLEELYAEVELRVQKAPKPKPSPAHYKQLEGFPPKFLVLLFSRKTELERYLSVFLNDNTKQPKRHIFPKNGSPLFATAVESYPTLHDDSALHAHVVFHVVHNMVDAYRGNYYRIPVWFPEGLAHYYSRRIDDGASNWSVQPRSEGDMREQKKTWEQLERSLAKAKTYTPLDEVMAWTSFDKLRFKDHLASWSRVSYLMSLDEQGLGTFLNGLKGQRHATGATISGPEVLKRQANAFEAAWKRNGKSIDEAWQSWVLSKKKPKKRRE